MIFLIKSNKCPICRKHLFNEKYEICPVCGWENDPVQKKDKDFAGGANKMSQREARKAYKERKKA